MVKIPIEIITYILDYVDLRTATRFAIATSKGGLNGYLEERMKLTHSEVMSEINKTCYTISRDESHRDDVKYNLYYSQQYDSYNIYDMRDVLVVSYGKLNITGMYGVGYRMINREESRSCDPIVYVKLTNVKTTINKTYIRSSYGRVNYD